MPQEQAEAHAEAARDFIMVELATRADLVAVRADLVAMKQELRSNIDELRTELHGSIGELRTELRTSVTELRGSIAELRNNIDTQSLRLTVRLGAMLAVAIGALAALLKLA